MSLLTGLLVFGVIVLLIIWFRRGKSEGLGIPGHLIWVDEGPKTKPFFNREYRVLGKPDLMYRVDGEVLAVEYKSRHGRIYESDIVQSKCAALAARGDGYRVGKILVKTAKTEQVIPLPKSDHQLYREIESSVALARRAKTGQKVPSNPSRLKCSSCAYQADCGQAVRS